MVELLSPVGDFECLKAAVQNGANAVYFGASLFNARANATNFNDENLKLAINYAKIRGVKTHLTLNICLKEKELEDAFNLAKKAYKYGIDAIIVQDFGLANLIIEKFPDLEIHASTQMTIHNLEGAKLLEKLGFKRAVLARELSLDEIKYICDNSNIEIETFMHGALCISYSGQCLLSSMIGGRSGNRGKCAQPCRLPYELVEVNRQNYENNYNMYNNCTTNLKNTSNQNDFKIIDKGYLLSPRDLCTLEALPDLIKTGVNSLKIEGRMKSPEYVATVTRIYRKYIDLAYKYINNEISSYTVEIQDKKDLMQVFNRGGFSLGHLDSKENKKLIFKEKPNNMGLLLGTVSKINQSKGHITCKLQEAISIGDGISFENENTKYTISELMENNKNLKNAEAKQIVTFGRMKGNIRPGDKIYKISDKALLCLALESYSKENIHVPVKCFVHIKAHEKIGVNFYVPKFDLRSEFIYDYTPDEAQKAPITSSKIYEQFSKTGNSVFEFSKLEIDLDENLFMPVSVINDVRRTALENIENEIYGLFKRQSNAQFSKNLDTTSDISNSSSFTTPTNASILLNSLNSEYDYSSLKNVDRIYIPLRYFINSKYEKTINSISKLAKIYVYMPSIIRKNYMSNFKAKVSSFEKFNLAGFVVSNLSHLELIEELNLNKYEIIGNYTLNIYNAHTAFNLRKFNVSTFTISPELDKNAIIDFCKATNLNKEMIVYGNLPVMTMNYCPLGKVNKCYSGCDKKCMKNDKYFLKDRLGMMFRIIPDNSQTISTLYNSKTLSIDYSDFDVNSIRIDILDENVDKINEIVSTVCSGNRCEGKEFTNGNLNREI